jgi:carotenoid cleavage dioxygenase-like enzyme
MRTGKALKKILSKRSLELGSINASYVGKNNRYAYLGIAEKIPKRLIWKKNVKSREGFMGQVTWRGAIVCFLRCK